MLVYSDSVHFFGPLVNMSRPLDNNAVLCIILSRYFGLCVHVCIRFLLHISAIGDTLETSESDVRQEECFCPYLYRKEGTA